MARIGRQIPHYKTIDRNSVNAVFSEDRKYRYLLSMNYEDTLLDRDRNRSIAVIMKNPSSADEQMADATIRKVETFIYNRFPDVRNLHILNIFAFRATEPGDLDDAFTRGGALEVIGGENDRIILSVIEEVDYIILGWGNSSGIDRSMYEERIYRVKMLLKQVPQQKIFSVAGEKQTKHPLHGLMWGYDYTIMSVPKIPGYL